MGTDIEEHRDRPTAVWFRAARASQTMDDGAGGTKPWTVDELFRRMEAEVHWTPSRPNYSTYENGHTVPKPATMAKFYRFWKRYGIEPPDLSPPVESPGGATTPGLSDLIASISALVEEIRAARRERADLEERVLALELAARLRERSPDGEDGEPAAPRSRVG